MRNYQCMKCGTLITNDRRPTSFGCPNGGNHQWNELGECGNNRYQCIKCGTLIGSRNRPMSFGCPKGGNHQWNNL